MDTSDSRAERFGRWLAAAGAALSGLSQESGGGSYAQVRRRALARRESVKAANAAATARFTHRRSRLSSTWKMFAVTAFAASLLAVLDVATPAAVPGVALLWVACATGLTWLAWRTRATVRALVLPAEQMLPAIPPPILAPNCPGAEQAAELAQAEATLFAMIEPVAAVHPDAGAQLRDTFFAVQPGLYALVERAALVYTARSFDAAAADAAGQSLAARLNDALLDYRALIAAAAELLASPDLDGQPPSALSNATQELYARSAGLYAATPAADTGRTG